MGLDDLRGGQSSVVVVSIQVLIMISVVATDGPPANALNNDLECQMAGSRPAACDFPL
jgi:hypothetical protein